MQAPDLRLSSREIEAAVQGMAGDLDDRKDLFARAAWSGICEPGDGFGGLLAHLLGPAKILQLLIDGLDASALAGALTEVGSSIHSLGKYSPADQHIIDSRERWVPRLSASNLLEHLDRLRHCGGDLIPPSSVHWPDSIDDLGEHRPFLLWARGAPGLLKIDQSIAVVGSRGVTEYGRRVTQELTHALSEAGVMVVSGGALGVDAIAHEVALASQGATVAVLAGGVDRLYPSANRRLLEGIVQNGLVVSELPMGSSPTRWRFLQRNRLIAALGQATLVTEANWKSGALNTARHATALDRPIGAVPGPIDAPKSVGCNRLIEDQVAVMVTGEASLVNLLPSLAIGKQQYAIQGLGALETRVLDAIGFSALPIDQICRDAGVTRSEARLALGELLMGNLVERHGTDWAKSRTNL